MPPNQIIIENIIFFWHKFPFFHTFNLIEQQNKLKSIIMLLLLLLILVFHQK